MNEDDRKDGSAGAATPQFPGLPPEIEKKLAVAFGRQAAVSGTTPIKCNRYQTFTDAENPAGEITIVLGSAVMIGLDINSEHNQIAASAPIAVAMPRQQAVHLAIQILNNSGYDFHPVSANETDANGNDHE